MLHACKSDGRTAVRPCVVISEVDDDGGVEVNSSSSDGDGDGRR